MNPVYNLGYTIGQRWRYTLLIASAAYIVGGLTAFYWHEELFGVLLAPAGGRLSPFDGKPLVTAPTSAFGLTLGLAFQAGKLASTPFWIVGLLTIIKPLTPFDWWKRFVVYNVAAAVTLFTLGGFFVYYVMLPVSMTFLLSFATTVVEPAIILDMYLELLFSLFKWIGLVFLIPLIMHIAARAGILTYRRAKSVWRIGFFLSMFFSAIISPGFDGVLTGMVFGAMYSLYLVGLGAVWQMNPETGNFLFFWTIYRGVDWLWQQPVGFYRTVRYWLRKQGI